MMRYADSRSINNGLYPGEQEFYTKEWRENSTAHKMWQTQTIDPVRML